MILRYQSVNHKSNQRQTLLKMFLLYNIIKAFYQYIEVQCYHIILV